MSDSYKKEALGELKNINEPLLGGDLMSPKASPVASQDDDVNIPDPARENNDFDAMSGFTQADYKNPQKMFKNENQSKLDGFLAQFAEQAGTKLNQRYVDGESKIIGGDESEMSDGTVTSQPAPPIDPKEQAKVASIIAPDDAKGCKKIDSLSEYCDSESKLIANPRRAYFQLAKAFYNKKYPHGFRKQTIKVDCQNKAPDNKNYVRHLNVDIIQTNLGNMPVVKTFEYNPFDYTKFVKSIKFYDLKNETQLRNSIAVDDGIMDEQYKTYDVSTLYFQNYVIFYQRQDQWLQLQRYDVITHNISEIPGYQIQIEGHETARYHPIFAQDFATDSKKQAQSSFLRTQNLKDFLDQQFVFCQTYRLTENGNEAQSVKMFSLQDTNTPIQWLENSLGVVQDPIQKVLYAKNHDDRDPYVFILFDPFKSHVYSVTEDLQTSSHYAVYHAVNETQMQLYRQTVDPSTNKNMKYQNLAPFISHENPQFQIMVERVKLSIIQKNYEVDQYFYLTNDNQLMLIYPNYKDLRQKQDVYEQLAESNSYILTQREQFNYQNDLKQRKTDHDYSKMKKVPHVSHDFYRSQSYMKESKHIQEIIEYPSKLVSNHRVILSTDSESSDIYIYQSQDANSKSTIEVFRYDNVVDRASSLSTKGKGVADGEEVDSGVPKLPKQIQEVMIEEKKFAKRMTSKVAEEDANCYYMNAHFKNVISSRYCIKTQSKSQVTQQSLVHSLPPSDSKMFCLVEGTSQTHQQYYNIRTKHDHMKEDIELQMYYRSKHYYIFLFSLVKDVQKNEKGGERKINFDRRQNYFFIRLSYQQVNELSQDNHKSVISHDQEVYMVMENDLVGTTDEVNQKYLERIKFKDLIQLQATEQRQEYHIHLTLETLYDMRKRCEFLPFIYQEKKSLASHHMLVLDINLMQVVSKICINSNLKIRPYLRKSEAGYAMYTITRTSEVMDQKLNFMERMRASNDSCVQVVKFQLTHQYYLEDSEEHSNPAKSTLEFSEYLIHYNNQTTISSDIKLIGRKQLLLSDVAQFKREQSFDKLFILPYFDRSGDVKGSQLILKEDEQVIKIIDQDQNKIYQSETEMVQFGQLKFLVDKSSHDEYLLLISSQLKKKVYMKGNLETSEAYYILSKIQKKVMSMQLAKFENYVLTDNFDRLMKEEFFQPQEVLQGKTVCDICLNYPKDIARGLKFDSEKYSRIDGSLIDELCLGDQEQIAFYRKIGLCEENLMIQPDFNFVTTLRLAMELGANSSVKLLLKEIFTVNSSSYQEVLMLDLPKLLEKDYVERLYPFLERNHDELNAIIEDQDLMHVEPNRIPADFCNIENYVINTELAPFSAEKISHYVKSEFIDYHDTVQEVMCEVIMKDPYMTWDINNFCDQMDDMKKKRFEVEHSLIDFSKLIIGEKIRGYQEEFQNVEFNDQHLAEMLYKEDGTHLKYYSMETIQKLIDFQFIKTKQFLGLMLRLYIFGFLGPFILSITFDNLVLKNFCYVMCLLTQCFFMFFEFVQMKQFGLSYFKDFWNCIDISQFAAFTYLFLNKLITQFQSDTIMEILFSAMILFLSIYKLMYFIRIYDSCNDIILIIQAVTFELIPFAVVCVSLLFALSKIYQVLHMGVNDPQNLYAQITSDLMKLFMQTIKLSTGDKTPPTLDKSMNDRLDESVSYKAIFIFFLEIVWALQQVLSGIFGLFAVAKVTSSFEKTLQNLELLAYQSKAKFNCENFQVLNLLKRQEPFKVIFFQIDKTILRNKHKKFEGVTRSIEKILKRSDDKKKDMKKDDDKQRERLIMLQDTQLEQLQDIKRDIGNRPCCCPQARQGQ